MTIPIRTTQECASCLKANRRVPATHRSENPDWAGSVLCEPCAVHYDRVGVETGSLPRPVDRSGCRESVCSCHEDALWVSGAFPDGVCSWCGCRWAG
jgi:hypothetical protein